MKKKIPNPKRLGGSNLSDAEKAFINEADDISPEKPKENLAANKPKRTEKEKKKPYNFSMTPSFYRGISDFVEEYPEEGTMSNVVTRAVASYMKEKRNS
ncbi:MAG: hypothetical protein AAF693_12950 [Bacteroidota bacterium]